MQITTIGIDLAKTVFQLHAVDADGATVMVEYLSHTVRSCDDQGRLSADTVGGRLRRRVSNL